MPLLSICKNEVDCQDYPISTDKVILPGTTYDLYFPSDGWVEFSRFIKLTATSDDGVCFTVTIHLHLNEPTRKDF